MRLSTLDPRTRRQQESQNHNNRFNKQNNTFARASHFFVLFFQLDVFARLRCENARRANVEILFLSWNLDIRSVGIQLQLGSPTFDKVSGQEKSRWSLKERKFTFSATFSLQSRHWILKSLQKYNRAATIALVCEQKLYPVLVSWRLKSYPAVNRAF